MVIRSGQHYGIQILFFVQQLPVIDVRFRIRRLLEREFDVRLIYIAHGRTLRAEALKFCIQIAPASANGN